MRSTASFTNGCYASHLNETLTFNNASTELRAFTSFTKHFLTKSTKSLDHPDEDNDGGSPFNTRFTTFSIVSPANGCLPSAISITLMPSDHTSLFSTAVFLYNSGPAYSEVPQNPTRFENECSSCTASPKSPTFTTPLSDSSRLSGLMSYTSLSIPIITRCITFRLCRYDNPSKQQLTTSRNSSSFNRFPLLKYAPIDPQ